MQTGLVPLTFKKGEKMSTAVDFEMDEKTGKFRAEVKVPVPPHATMGALRRIQRVIGSFLQKRPSEEYNFTHKEGYCSFWVAINPKAPLDAIKRTNTLRAALQEFVEDVTIDYDKLKALH